jgi:enamine deaminase RidA (YjgF/YER057c/UK114 family)
VTVQIPARAPFLDAAHNAAVAKLQSLYAGQIPDSVAREIVGAALIAAWPQIADHFATLIETQNPDRDVDFSAGVDWAADTIRNA